MKHTLGCCIKLCKWGIIKHVLRSKEQNRITESSLMANSSLDSIFGCNYVIVLFLEELTIQSWKRLKG